MWLYGPLSSLNDKAKSPIYTPWRLGSIETYKHMFCAPIFVLGRYVFQLIVLLKQDSNCLYSFTLSWVNKVTRGNRVLYQLF